MFESIRGLVVIARPYQTRIILFILAIISGLACWIATSLHYANKFYGNPVTWIAWLISIEFLLWAFLPSLTQLREKLSTVKKISLLFFGLLVLFFIISHLWNFGTAPWNQNGLFDDAAWDIYFAKNYICTSAPFQAAFFDCGISREVVFHYYITGFFKLFGYNLLIFNISLLILGLTTFIFTCMLIQQLFHNYWVTLISAVVFNFLPLHFIHIFVGHRYAMDAPLMMASIYFLYTGFKNKSGFRIVFSAILAALCMDSAIMGKQYLLGIFGALVLLLLFDFKKFSKLANWNLVILFTVSLVVAMIPLIVYIIYNPIYFRHESSLTQGFLNAARNWASNELMPYVDRTRAVFFGSFTYYREFLPEFVVIPFVYYLFLIPGLLLAVVKKHFAIILLALIPIMGAFVSGCYDFRVLQAAPFWIILMAFALNEVWKKCRNYENTSQNISQHLIVAGSLIALLIGLIPCIDYIYWKSEDPNSICLLPQKDVAVSRFLRDVVAGVPKPSPGFRLQEFNKLQGYPEPTYDTLICQNFGYAITHLFLKDYGDTEIMSFSDQLPFNLFDESQILYVNKRAIETYRKTTKDLKLIWEIDEKTTRIITEFSKLNYFGSDQLLSSKHAGREFSFYVLNIKNNQIDAFKQKVRTIEIY